MGISTNYCVSPSMVNFKSQKNEKKMSPIMKGTLYGAGIGAGCAGVSVGILGVLLKSLEMVCKTPQEKRNFLNKIVKFGEKQKCYSKTLKNGLKAIKTWKPWATSIAIGAAAGALIGCFKKEK